MLLHSLTRNDVPGARGDERRSVHLVRQRVEVVDLNLLPAERPRLERELAGLRNGAAKESRNLCLIVTTAAYLDVEGKVADVDHAGGAVHGRRHPHHVAGGVDEAVGLVLRLSADLLIK